MACKPQLNQIVERGRAANVRPHRMGGDFQKGSIFLLNIMGVFFNIILTFHSYPDKIFEIEALLPAGLHGRVLGRLEKRYLINSSHAIGIVYLT